MSKKKAKAPTEHKPFSSEPLIVAGNTPVLPDIRNMVDIMQARMNAALDGPSALRDSVRIELLEQRLAATERALIEEQYMSRLLKKMLADYNIVVDSELSNGEQ